jgi:FkbM family methyltransferase
MPRTLDLIQRARPWQVGAAIRVLLRYRPDVHEVRGFRLWLDPSSNMGYRLLKDGDLESEMTEGIERILRPGGTFVDLGGNEGWYSLVAARAVGREGRVLCVEPQERLWPVVLRNFELNGFAQAELVPVAAGPESTEAEIALAPKVNTGASSMAVKGGWRRLLRRHQKVLVRPLDAIVEERGLRDVDLVKIDIEGFEYHALRSGERLLKEKRIRNILMELHDAELAALGQSRDDVLRLLASHGYREVSRDTSIHHFAPD